MRRNMVMARPWTHSAPQATEEKVPGNWLSFVVYETSKGWTVVTKERTFWLKRLEERWYQEVKPGVWEISLKTNKGRKMINEGSKRANAWLEPMVNSHGYQNGQPRRLGNAHRVTLPSD